MAEREPMRHHEKLLHHRDEVVRAHIRTHDVRDVAETSEPVAGVGAFSGPRVGAGAGLGGDAGDVSVPHTRTEPAEFPEGGTHGASALPEASTVMEHRQQKGA